MKKRTIKYISILTLILLLLSTLTINTVYGENNIYTTISKTEVKNGENFSVDISLDNIPYNSYKIVLKSDILGEPTLDSNVTDITNINTVFSGREFTISGILAGTSTISVVYLMPSYIKAGTEITIDIDMINLEDENEKISESVTVKVAAESNNVSNENNNNEQSNVNNQNTNSNNQSVQGDSLQTMNGESSQSNSSLGASNQSGTGETVEYKGDNNNYLSGLEVQGYELELEFNKTNDTYFITVPNSVTSLDVSATKELSSSTLQIAGNTNLKTGLNKILISVTSESGSIRNYRIYVTREG